MNNTPFFTIITVSFNAEQYIKSTIESTLAQSYTDYEIVVKDGLSKDKTLELIPNDPRIRVYSSADSGIYNAMNQAIGYSQGKYLIFMNCGDIFNADDVLEIFHKFITEKDEEKSGIIIGDCISKGLYKTQNGCTNRFKQYRCSGFAHQSMFFKKEVFDTLGGYDESFRVYADFEMFMRSFQANNGIGYLAYPVCAYMGGGFSAQKSTKKLLDDDKKRIRKKYFSPLERGKYFVLFHMTFPRIRNRLESDRTPKWLMKGYRKLTNRLACGGK